jgi:hypothetical protein
LQSVLEAALGHPMALPKRKLRSMAEFVAAFPEVERVILDATERPVQRSKDKDQQKENYSGKKKRHTRSHLALVEPTRNILVLSQAYAGRHNDKGILNQEGWAEWIPDEVLIQGDLGFFGLQNEVVNVDLPHKKPRGGQLTDEQKATIVHSPASVSSVSMRLRGSSATALPIRSIATAKRALMTARWLPLLDYGTSTWRRRRVRAQNRQLPATTDRLFTVSQQLY